MKALVTGATGFIGSHLVDTLLEEGYHVRILTRPQSTTNLTGTHLETQEGDLLDPHSLHKACTDIDLIFHLAADPRDWGNKHTIIQTNLTGTQNLLDASLHKKVTHVIYMSSAAVYGFPHTTTPLTEDTPLHPTPAYGESKLQAEQLLWKYGIDHHIHVTAIRSPLATGPRDRLAAPALLPAIKNRRLFTIGDGHQTISISDGRDVAVCLFQASETHKSNGQAYNVKSFDSTIRTLIDTAAAILHTTPPTAHHSYATAYTLAYLAELIAQINHKRPPLTRHVVKVLGHTRILDISKAERDLGYRPRYGLQHTIADTVTWLEANQPKTL